MAHGRTIAEQTVSTVTGLANVFQSNDAPTRVFLGITEPRYTGEDELVSASLTLTPAEAIDLAQKLMREAGYAFTFTLDLQARDGQREAWRRANRASTGWADDDPTDDGRREA